MPTVITQGAASAKGYGFGARATAANYIEDVFSTYLYTGNSTSGGTQTITNGIDLSTKGGLVWIKGRSAASDHVLFDTTRGAGTTASNNKALSSNLQSTEGLSASYDFLSAFNADGFTVKQGGAITDTRGTNYNNVTYASWTFRKQAKFFDVVTYTGNGTNRTIAHNLGSVPGCIFVKRISGGGDWCVYHRGMASANNYVALNSPGGQGSSSLIWNDTAPTSSVFSVGTSDDVNRSNNTYIAYLFAHDAGGFGASGSDNAISCGSLVSTSGNVSVTLGYEPQLVIIKGVSATSSWTIADVMRGFAVTDYQGVLANSRNAEAAGGGPYIFPTSTGFVFDSTAFGASGLTYIYIAIRRGPMKTPTSGTSVFSPVFGTSSGDYRAIYSFAPDMQIRSDRSPSPTSAFMGSRLQGNARLFPKTTGAESTDNGAVWEQTQFRLPGITGDYSGWINWGFRRAPGFFDVVCYTGNGVDDRLISHNLTVIPELIIAKNRSNAWNWAVFCSKFTNNGIDRYAFLNTSDSLQTGNVWSSTLSPTASNFPVSGNVYVNQTGSNHVAYLFATVAGVSKVGSYTGTGTTQQINCGFTAGARFVLIKRTDSTGDWYVWDSARGIVAGNDPYLLLNSTAAEVTSTDYIDTYSAGFEISSTAPAAINANGGSFIFLAIA